MTTLPASESVPRGGRIASFLERVKNLLLHPWQEWRAIAVERTTTRDVYLHHVAPLAAVAVAGVFGASTFVGVESGLATLRTGFLPALAGAAVAFALALVGVHVLERVAARLAAKPGEDLRLPALRVVAYATTPAWLAVIVVSIPMLEVVAWAGGLYGAFLLFLGVRIVLRRSAMNAIGDTMIISMCAAAFAVVTMFATGFTNGLLGLGQPTLQRGPAERARVIGAVGGILGRIVVESDAEGRSRVYHAVGALFGRTFDEIRGREHEGAQSLLDQAVATVAVIARAGRQIDPVPPEALSMLLPPSLTGMARVEVDVKPMETRPMRTSTVKARYENMDGRITVELNDSGEATGIVRAVTWIVAYLDETTAWGYERKRRLNGQFLEEKYNRLDRYGKMMLVIDERFVVRVDGSGVDDKALLEAVQSVDARTLEALAKR